jgi:antitoxin (DNA-binding transcriptional repressor) of toxin-antitoxin stability system
VKIIAVQELQRTFDEVLFRVEGGEQFEIQTADGHAVALLLPIEHEAHRPTERQVRAAASRRIAGIDKLADQMARDVMKYLGT